MELQMLESSLIELSSLCEQLAALLESKRQAMKVWQVEQVEALTMEEELLLERVRSEDQEFRQALERLARDQRMTTTEILNHPKASRLRALRARVETAQRAVRQQGAMTQALADHLTGFLKKMQGETSASVLTYGPGLSALQRSHPFLMN